MVTIWFDLVRFDSFASFRSIHLLALNLSTVIILDVQNCWLVGWLLVVDMMTVLVGWLVG